MADAHRGVDHVAIDIHDLDHRDRGRFQHRARAAVMFQPRQDHPRGPPGQHVIQHRLLARERVVRDPNHRLERRIVQLGRDPAEHVGKHQVRQRRNDHSDQIDMLAGQPAGDLVGHISQRLGGGQHLLARGSRDIAAIAQHPADGHFGHARGFGHIAQRQRPAFLALGHASVLTSLLELAHDSPIGQGTLPNDVRIGRRKAAAPWLNWIEQPPPKGQVTGSSPVGVTN